MNLLLLEIKIIISGEITSSANINYEKIIKDDIKEVGYDNVEKGLDYNNLEIETYIHKQSDDIARGVNSSLDTKKIGAGDQ